MTITPQNGDLTAGVASQRSENIAASPDPFITGDFPSLVPTDELLPADIDYAARLVVGFDDNGALVPAVTGSADPADDVQAIGVLVYAQTVPAGTTDRFAGVYRQGCFNPDLLTWPASFDTDAKKRKAFEGAPSPTSIVIRKPQAMTV